MIKPKDEVEVVSKPWQWPSEWAKDQAFWRDIATKTISGLVIAVVVYVYGVVAGYFGTPSNAAKIIGLGGLFVIPIFSIAISVFATGKGDERKKRLRNRLTMAALATAGVSLLALFFLVISGETQL